MIRKTLMIIGILILVMSNINADTETIYETTFNNNMDGWTSYRSCSGVSCCPFCLHEVLTAGAYRVYVNTMLPDCWSVDCIPNGYFCYKNIDLTDVDYMVIRVKKVVYAERPASIITIFIDGSHTFGGTHNYRYVKDLKNYYTDHTFNLKEFTGVHEVKFDTFRCYLGVAPGSQNAEFYVYWDNIKFIGGDYTIRGDTSCNNCVDLLKLIDDTYIFWEQQTGTSYLFDTLNGCEYKLLFSDGHEYVFTANNDIVYDYDSCNYCNIKLVDACGNLLKNVPYAVARENYVDYPLSWQTSATGIVEVEHGDSDYIEIYFSGSHDWGRMYAKIYSPQDTTWQITHPTIQWINTICIKNASTYEPIQNALVTVVQDCIIDKSLYPTRNKYTDSNGRAVFDQCELNNMVVTVSKEGYTGGDIGVSIGDLDATHFTRTVNIYLGAEIPEQIETFYYTDLYFKNTDGDYAGSVYNNTSYIDLHYYTNNSEHSNMILLFQKGSEEILRWNIPYNENSYKRIYNTDFSDAPNLYRGYLYSANKTWDKRANIMVYDWQRPVFGNIQVDIFFYGKNIMGDIDYKEDIRIISYAYSNESYLLNISLELYEEDILKEYINLTSQDYEDGIIFHEYLYQHFYDWKPEYAYLNNKNYTVKMIGYDGAYLYSDMVFAKDYRKNKLTICVRDNLGNDIDNALIYLEGYGELSTGLTNFNSYEELENGYYRYKASKSGYVSGAWNMIELNDNDAIVTYILQNETIYV